MQLNKVHSVRTLALVARDLDEDEDWLADIANEMEPEDGLIWVYDPEHEEAQWPSPNSTSKASATSSKSTAAGQSRTPAAHAGWIQWVSR
jgi:hypothetical protein